MPICLQSKSGSVLAAEYSGQSKIARYVTQGGPVRRLEEVCSKTGVRAFDERLIRSR